MVSISLIAFGILTIESRITSYGFSLLTVLSDELLFAGIEEIEVRTDSVNPIWDLGGSSGAESNAGLVLATCSCNLGEKALN